MSLTEETIRHREYGVVLLGRGLYVAALAEFREWLAIAEQSGNLVQVIPPLNALALGYHDLREFELSLSYLQRAMHFAEHPAVSETDKAKTYVNLIMVHASMGHLDEALQAAEKAAALPIATQGELGLVFCLNLSLLYWRRQEWVQMRRAARKAHQLSVAAGDAESSARAMTNLGIAHLELGAYRLAEKNLNGALCLCEEIDSPQIAYVHAELGRLHYLRGEYQEALERGRKALTTLLTGMTTPDKEEVARVSRLFGVIFLTSGQRNLTLKYLNRAAAYFSQLGLRAEWQRSTELIGKVLAEPVRPVRGPLLEEAHKLDFLTAFLDLTDDLESVDPSFRGHAERVAHLAVRLGEEIGLSADELLTLNHAASLHDVGMIAVDTELLQREGPLTKAEKERVDLHTVIGEEMIRPYGFSATGLAAIRHHHERWDGMGKPDRLAGTEIPLLARLVTIADVYDALTSERIYRRAKTHAQALVEMREMRGKLLDPDLVDRFLALHER